MQTPPARRGGPGPAPRPTDRTPADTPTPPAVRRRRSRRRHRERVRALQPPGQGPLLAPQTAVPISVRATRKPRRAQPGARYGCAAPAGPPRAALAGTRSPARRPGPRRIDPPARTTEPHRQHEARPGLRPRRTNPPRRPPTRRRQIRERRCVRPAPPTRPGRPGAADTCSGEGPDPSCSALLRRHPGRVERIDRRHDGSGVRADEAKAGCPIDRVRFGPIRAPRSWRVDSSDSPDSDLLSGRDGNLGLGMRRHTLGVRLMSWGSYGIHSQARGKRAYGELLEAP